MGSPFLVLVVHNQPEALGEIVELLTGRDLKVHTARSATEGMHRLQSTDYAVIICGHKPPLLDGIELLGRSALYRADAMRIALLTGARAEQEFDERRPDEHNIFRITGRSAQRGNLGALVSEALKLQRLMGEQRELVRRLGTEYDKLQKREKLLDVVVKERTKELEESYDRLKASHRQALFGLAEAIEAKDAYTKGHCGRVAGYSLVLAEEAGYNHTELETMEFGAFLHDIGKIGVRDQVLLKPGPLDEEEWAHMRRHPVMGHEIAKQIEILHPIMPAVRNHHERWDGHGYPDKLAAENIPMSARIVAIADAYDALATERPYKRALSLEESEVILLRNASKMFDPELVELFCQRHVGALYLDDYGEDSSAGAAEDAASDDDDEAAAS